MPVAVFAPQDLAIDLSWLFVPVRCLLSLDIACHWASEQVKQVFLTSIRRSMKQLCQTAISGLLLFECLVVQPQLHAMVSLPSSLGFVFNWP